MQESAANLHLPQIGGLLCTKGVVIVGSEGGLIGGDARDNVCMLCASIFVVGVDNGMVLVCVGDGAGKY